MALSKLKAKSVERTGLYYGKFEYRLVVTSPHMFYSFYCKDIDTYRDRIAEICAEYEANEHNNKWLNWRRPKPDVSEWEYELIENILNLAKTYTPSRDYTIRREGSNCNIYTSNTQLAQHVLSFYPVAEVTKVELMPAGVLLFKREPPAKYRAYFTNNKVPPSFKEDFLEYLSRTPDIVPSMALETYLNRPSKFFYNHYLWDKYYVDYNDDKNLMMLMLMFPDAIGKRYKLEKK